MNNVIDNLIKQKEIIRSLEQDCNWIAVFDELFRSSLWSQQTAFSVWFEKEILCYTSGLCSCPPLTTKQKSSVLISCVKCSTEYCNRLAIIQRSNWSLDSSFDATTKLNVKHIPENILYFAVSFICIDEQLARRTLWSETKWIAITPQF